MLRKIILSLVALLFLAPPAFVAFENFRGRTELDSVLADLTAKGEKLDIRQIAPPPIPVASNGIHRFLAAAEAVTLNPELQPPALQWIAPARAWAGATRSNWTTTGGRVVEWSELAAWKSNHLADLENLRAVLSEPTRQPVLDYNEGFKLLLPHLAKMKSAVSALGSSLSEAAHRRDFDAALADLRCMRQVAIDLENQPLLIDQLVRIACEAIASNRAWELLQSHEWTDDQLAKLQSVLEQVDLMDGMLTALAGERALVLATVTRLSTRELLQLGDVSGDNPSGGSPAGGMGAAGANILRLAWGNQALAHYLRTFQILLEANRQAAREHSQKPLDSLTNLVPTATWNPRHFFTRMILPAIANASTKALRAETERALLVTGLAIRRYQLRHQGRVPENLQVLVPDLLNSVPIDRMDGAPLRYRVDSPKAFTLWSVGSDQFDQGGDGSFPQENANHRGNVPWWLAVDAVWPQQASLEELAAWQQVETERQARKSRNQPAGTTATMSPELLKRYGLMPPTNAAPNPSKTK